MHKNKANIFKLLRNIFRIILQSSIIIFLGFICLNLLAIPYHIHDTYIEIAANSIKKGNLQKAKSSLEQLILVEGFIHGKKSNYYASSLEKLALFYSYGFYDDIDKALKLSCEVEFMHSNYLNKKEFKELYGALTTGGGLELVYKNLGDYDKAEKIAIERLKIIRKKDYFLSNSDEVKKRSILLFLANLYESKGEYGKAESLYEQAYKIYSESKDENNLFNFFVRIGKKEKPSNREYYKREIKRLESSLRNYDEDLKEKNKYILNFKKFNLMIDLVELGYNYYQLENYKKAEEIYEKINPLIINPKFKVHSTNNLALVYLDQGKYNKAEKCLKESVNIIRSTFENSHPDLTGILNKLGLVYIRLGEYKQAEKVINESLSISKKKLAYTNLCNVCSYEHLGQLYRHLGKKEKAEEFYQKAIDIRNEAIDENYSLNDSTIKDLELFCKDK